MSLDETRQALMAHARDHYLEVGGGTGFSLREVARRTGVSAAAVYRHFDSKEALFAAIVTEGFRVFQSFLMRSLAKTTARERLRAAGDQYLAFALEHDAHYSVLFMSRKATATATAHLIEDASTFQFLVDRVRECVEAKILRKDDPVALAASIWAHVHGLVALRLTGHLTAVGDDDAFRKFYRSSVDDHLRGLAP